jgi:hypothetical protein
MAAFPPSSTRQNCRRENDINISQVVFANCLSVAALPILSCWSLDRIEWKETDMVKSRQQTARKPASKFANLQKKMQKQKAQAKQKTGKRK